MLAHLISRISYRASFCIHPASLFGTLHWVTRCQRPYADRTLLPKLSCTKRPLAYRPPPTLQTSPRAFCAQSSNARPSAHCARPSHSGTCNSNTHTLHRRVNTCRASSRA